MCALRWIWLVMLVESGALQGAGPSAAAPLDAPLDTPVESEQRDRPRTVVTFTPDNRYPRYLADPRRARTGLSLLHIGDPEVEDAGEKRWGLWIGERFPLARFHPEGEPDGGVQLDMDVGFFGQFDLDYGNDNLGWDGVYAFSLSGELAERQAWRFGVAHDSSHVGDEFIERTGRERIGYTREEVFVALARAFGDGGQAYLEYGHAYDLDRDAGMERGRAQVGVQLEPTATGWGGRLGSYFALDVSAFEENDWDVNVTAQVGWVVSRGDRGQTLRLGVQGYDGRTPMGEFYDEDETHVAVSLWFEL